MRLCLAALVAVSLWSCSASSSKDPETSQPPLWQRSSAEPYPFTTPVPPQEATAVDGTYTRTIPARIGGPSVKCARCAPYRIETGTTTLVLAEGRYSVAHQAPGAPSSSQFSARGHFELAGARIRLFNDANCPRLEGLYEWDLTAGSLRLEAIEDDCPFSGLRRRFFELAAWDLAA